MVNVIRGVLRVLPAAPRERLAVRLFMTQRRHAPRPREQKWQARGHQISVAGLHATSFGTGPVALLMHGWEGRGLQLCAFIDPLLARGYQVVALDGPNHGQNVGGVGALPTFAHFLSQAIEELQPQLIVAHSLGGAASIVAANRSNFAGKIVCLGGPPDTQPIFTRARNFMGLPESGRGRFLEGLRQQFEDYPMDDLLDIKQAAVTCPARLYAVLAEADDEIPLSESQGIIVAGGGRTVVVESSHRSVMWDEAAVAAALQFVDEAES